MLRVNLNLILITCLVTVSSDERPRYCNRKGDVSTNVLVACGPNLSFIYVLPRRKGSTEDS